MVHRKLFTLVDCLEETMDLWAYGRRVFDIPVHNTYIPVKTTLMPKPKLSSTTDELGIRYIDKNDKKTTTPRINPVAPLNPLKGVKISPHPGYRDDTSPNHSVTLPHKSFGKYRRLSKIDF